MSNTTTPTLLPHAARLGAFTWEKLPSIPDREGFAGSFAGVSGNALLVAGGANFPDKRPWEGGTKTWYDRVFVLDAPDGTWREAGRLPKPAGYGVSVSTAMGALFIGGGDARENFRDVWEVRWDGRSLSFTPLPALPVPLAMAAASQVGRTLYVVGGLARPDATTAENTLFSLDLDQPEKGWQSHPACPGGGRFLATAASTGLGLALFGGARFGAGADGKPVREWLRDAWLYTGTGWRPLADLPHPIVAAPGPAPVIAGRVLLLGGDDGAQVSTPPLEHRGFPRRVLAYDVVNDAWLDAGELPAGLVTTTLVPWRGRFVIPGGEQRPGVRSTEVWAGTP